jgi:hypothetical protein
MADRATLHHNELRPFRAWLESHGWRVTPGKADFQMFLARRKDSKTIIVWQRNAGEDYSVDDQGEHVVRQFFRDRRGG